MTASHVIDITDIVPGSPEWHMLRRWTTADDRTLPRMGASMVAVALGLHPYQSAVEGWLQWTGRAPEGSETLPMRVGRALEPEILREYEQETGRALVTRKRTYIHPEHPWLIASPDAEWDDAPSGLVEAKNTSLLWGDDIPQHVFIQCLTQMLVTGADVVDVAAIIRGRFHLYDPIEREGRNAESIALLLERVCEWYDRHLLSDEPPPPQDPDDARRLWPRSVPRKTIIAMPVHLLDLQVRRDAKVRMDAAEQEMRAADTRLKGYMGDAEALVGATPDDVLATWKSAKPRQVFDLPTFRSDHPGLYAGYCAERPGDRRFIDKGESTNEQ